MILSSTLLSISILLSVSLCYTPLTLGILILSLSISISVTLFLLFSSWLGICSVLIYIGGLLVMFSYFIALNPNLTLNLKLILSGIIISISMLFSFFVPMGVMFNPLIHSSFVSISLIISTSMIPLTTFLLLSLFFSLISVVKITQTKSGPLRPFLYV